MASQQHGFTPACISSQRLWAGDALVACKLSARGEDPKWRCGFRNFGEADYEALLELDSDSAVAPPQLSDAELGRLQTHIYHLKGSAAPKRTPRLLPGSAQGCPDKVGCAPALKLAIPRKAN